MNDYEKLAQLKKRRKEVLETAAPYNRRADELLKEYRDLEEEVKAREAFEAKKPRCSDHAVIRYLERHMDITFEEVRERLLTEEVVAAMNMGAQSVRHQSGVKLILKDKCIVTVVED